MTILAPEDPTRAEKDGRLTRDRGDYQAASQKAISRLTAESAKAVAMDLQGS
jgi:hypothetical protein